MSLNKVTVLKLIGRKAAAIVELLTPAKPFVESEDGALTVVERDFIEVDAELGEKLTELVANWNEPWIVYAAKYLDNDSVGGCNIWTISNAVERSNIVWTGGAKLDERYFWFVVPTEKFTLRQMSALVRLRAIRNQPSARRLLNHLIEAAEAWYAESIDSITIVITEPLRGTREDDEVRAAL